jgi:hypothetical protein
LQLVHWQSDALTTRLDLIRYFYYFYYFYYTPSPLEQKLVKTWFVMLTLYTKTSSLIILKIKPRNLNEIVYFQEFGF